MPERLVIYTDGACKGNPGAGGAAFVVLDSGDNIVCTASRPAGKCTNNQAEYFAIEYALDWCLLHPERDVEIRSDSQVVVRQINGEYKVANADLKDRHAAVRGVIDVLEHNGGKITFVYVPREQNRIADALAKDASNGRDTGLVWA